MDDKPKQITRMDVSCGIIFKRGENDEPMLLIIQRAADDHWPLYYECPRGKCDSGPNEKLVPCLKREVKEETGLDVVPLRYIDKFSYSADEGTRISTQFNFLCKMKDPNQEVKLSKEHDDYTWISTPGQAELLTLPEMKKTILKAFAMIEPNNKIVDYLENDFTPDPSIEEKKEYAFELVDTYLLGEVGADTVLRGLEFGRAVGHDLKNIGHWAKAKIEKKKRAMALRKKERERERQEKLKLAMKKQKERERQA